MLTAIAARPVSTKTTVPGSGIIVAVEKRILVSFGPVAVKTPTGKKSLAPLTPLSRQLTCGMQTAFGGASWLQGDGPTSTFTSNCVIRLKVEADRTLKKRGS